jgi:hypothetical protein
MILTVDELREHVSSELGDDALQRLLDDAEAAILAYAGAAGDVTELIDGGFARLALSRPAVSITSITERQGTTDTTLATDDYRIRAQGYVLERLTGGTNSRSTWRDLVTVVYEAADDTAIRQIVQVELVKLAITFDPYLASKTIGAWTETYATADKSIEEWRGEILARLSFEPGLMVVGR